MNIPRRAQGSSGSATLANLFALLAGLFFTVTAVNLYRYIAAEDAVQSAVDRASRCLTPTDAGCASVIQTAAAGEYDWYRTSVEQRETAWGKKYAYSAQLTVEPWAASYEYFRIHKVGEPPLLLDAGLAEVNSYSPDFSRYEHRFARVAMTADDQVAEPRYSAGPFPEFDLEFERALDDQPAANWYPVHSVIVRGRRQLQALGISMQSWSSPQRRIAAGGEEEFVSERIPVPVLDPAIPCSGGEARCRNDSAGTEADRLSWRQYAFVAIKPFAQVEPAGARSGSVTWGSRSLGAGLWVDVFDPSGREVSADTAAMRATNHFFCLGGRSPEEVTRQRWYNMWLRGPGGSNGGTSAICPGGDIDHSGLYVPRGGSFRVHGILRAQDADLQARVIFKTYVDAPLETTVTAVRTGTHNCSTEVALTAAGVPATCPAASACGFSAAAKNIKCSADPASVRSEAVCLTAGAMSEDPLAIALAPADCDGREQRLTCAGESFAPSASRCTPAGRILCGWKKSPVAGEIPAGSACPVHKSEALPCGGAQSGEVAFRADGQYGAAADCPAAIARIEDSRSRIENFKAQGVQSDPKITPLSLEQFSRGAALEFNPPHFDNSLTRPAGDQSAVTSATAVFLPQQTIYKHADSGWTPQLSAFPITAPAGAAFPAGFVQSNVTIARSGPDAAERIDQVYPFNLPSAFEIPQVVREDFSCVPDQQDNQSGQTVEQRLRLFASAQNAAALDPAIQFDWTADYLGIAQIATLGPPACPTIEKRTTETFSSGPGAYLGRFSSAAVPPGCAGDPDCRSEAVLSTVDTPASPAQYDSDLAKRIGQAELERMLPQTSFNCDGSGCARIGIDLTSGSAAEVRASYNLPLTFPVNLLIGSDYVQIVHSAREELEMPGAAKAE